MQQQPSDFTPDNTIYLNNLPFNGPSDFEEVQAVIKKALAPEDANVEIKVLDRRDRPDSYSVYALVKFNSKEKTAKVLSQGTLQIKGKLIKIEPYAGDKDYHIYVKNIHGLNQEQIEKHFSKYGKLDGVHIYTADDHNSCLIRFAKADDAEACLQFHQQNIDGCRLWLDRYINKEMRHEEYHRLFLNRIPVRADNRAAIETLLNEEFSKFGKLVRKVEVEFKEAQPKLGHAIVYFQTQNSAEEARLKFNRNLLGGEPLELDNFISRKDRDQKGQLYVSDIKAGVDQSIVRELFNKYGKVEAVNINKFTNANKGNIPLQRGTITFEDKNCIMEILSEAHKDERLTDIFLDGDVKVNIYLNKQEREEYNKATKKPRQAPLPNPTLPSMMGPRMFPYPYLPNNMGIGMPNMGMPNMGMPNMGMPNMGMPNMNMPNMNMPMQPPMGMVPGMTPFMAPNTMMAPAARSNMMK